MDLQYVYDDTTSPPTQSVLQYKVDPDTVYVSTDTEQMMVNLTITVYNPTSDTVNCQNFQFGIYVGGGGGQLASTDDGIKLTKEQSQWDTTANAVQQGDLYWYTAQPAGGAASVPLPSSDSFIFHLKNIAVNKVEGGTRFMILEVTDADPNGVQGVLTLSKEQGSLSIKPGSFEVIPPTPVSPGTRVDLSWEVVGAQYWLLYDTTLSKPLYDSRQDSQPKTSWQDTPEAWTEYELIAYAGQMFTFATAVAQVTNPRFTSTGVPTANPTSVDSGTASALSWQTADAAYVIVTAEGNKIGEITPDSGGNGHLQVNPVLTTAYTVMPYGAGGESGTGEQVTVSVNPPLIKSFPAPPESFAAGQAVILSWETESVTTLTLDPGGVSVPVNTDSYPVHPRGQVTYQLTGQQGPAGQGPTVESDPVTVTQQLETFPVERPGSLIYDGTYIWVASGKTLTRLLAADGSQQGTFQVSASDFTITHGGAYIWIANMLDGATPGNTITRLLAADGSDQGDIQVMYMPSSLLYDGIYIWVAGALGMSASVMRLLAADGSYQGSYDLEFAPQLGAYDGTYIWVMGGPNPGSVVNTLTRLLASDGSLQGTFTVGQNPIALAYDGTYIWAANYLDESVTRLLAIDGSLHGTFPVGRNPTALAYDGTCIWVANLFGNTVTRLLATDGSLQGTFHIGSPGGLIYDGTYIWVVSSDNNTVTRIRPSDWPLPGA